MLYKILEEEYKSEFAADNTATKIIKFINDATCDKPAADNTIANGLCAIELTSVDNNRGSA
jgi:hypothetical protein